MLSNNSNCNHLWLDVYGNLANRFKRNSEYIIKNLFDTKLLKLCSSQDLIISNGIKKWHLSCHMTYFHGLDSSFVDYVISSIHLLNCITNFELLNGYEPESDHKPLSLSLNIVMHTTHM